MQFRFDTVVLVWVLSLSSSFRPPMVRSVLAFNKIESGAIRRFQEYDKLCKTCPTLLQPKIATLEEMIMGLSSKERDCLLDNVSKRMILQQEQEEYGLQETATRRGVQTAADVYQFQTGQDPKIQSRNIAALSQEKDETKINGAAVEEQPTPDATTTAGATSSSSAPKEKFLKRINKTKAKLKSNKWKRDRFQKLVEYTDTLLTSSATTKQNHDDNDGPTMTATMMMDSTLYHEMDELQCMTRSELKMARLKYTAQQCKCEQKVAKCRVKLYGASLESSLLLQQQ